MFRLGHYRRAIASRMPGLLLGLASSVDSPVCATWQRKPGHGCGCDASWQRPRVSFFCFRIPVLDGPLRASGSIYNSEMSETGRTVPDMNEPLNRYDVTVTVRCDGGSRPDPAAFAAAADQAAWRRSASIISAHLADRIISVVTVTAPDRYAAVAVARAVAADALKRQALSFSYSADDRAQHRAKPAA